MTMTVASSHALSVAAGLRIESSEGSIQCVDGIAHTERIAGIFPRAAGELIEVDVLVETKSARIAAHASTDESACEEAFDKAVDMPHWKRQTLTLLWNGTKWRLSNDTVRSLRRHPVQSLDRPEKLRAEGASE